MTLDYVWKDVFRSARLGFSPKKIWIAVRGILYGLAGYIILSYLSLMASGWTIKTIWHEFRFIPLPFFNAGLNWYGWIIWGAGALWALFYYFVTLTAISKTTYEQLKGDEFYESREAWSFAYKNWKGTFLSPIYLALFIIALIVVGLLMGLVGRIPHVGQIVIGLMGFPIVAGALFIVYLTVVMGVVMLSAPAIVSTTESDTFDTLFEAFSVLNDQTWRYILWEVLLLITTFLGLLIFSYLVNYALILTKQIVSVWAGPRGWWGVMWNNAHWYVYMPYLPSWVAKFFPTFFTHGEFIHHTSTQLAHYPGATTTFGSLLLGLSFYLIIFVVLGYGISIQGAGQTLIYTILVKIKDKKDLLEEKEEELFEPEFEEELEGEEEIEEEEEEEVEEEAEEEKE